MIYLFTLLVFVIGLFLGLYFSFPEWIFIKRKSISTIHVHQHFNESEISVFNKILASNEKMISTQDLHLIINLEKTSVAELNRLTRNFLKDLNLKIQIVFGISNGIWQFDSADDKKLKYYRLSKKFNLNQLNRIFLS
jgi:hypothetical protein